MRSRAPLALMEQLIMVLVFALAATLCLRIFVWSDLQSRDNQAHDQAVVQAQSAAELTKLYSGDFRLAASTYGGTATDSTWQIHYNKVWQITTEAGAYILTVCPLDSTQQNLCGALVEVTDAQQVSLFQLPVHWQEVDADG